MSKELIEPDTSFLELGFDSLTLTELCDLLNRTYTLDLVPPVLFEYPAVRGFAEFLARTCRGSVSSALCSDLPDPQSQPQPRLSPACELQPIMRRAADADAPIAIIGMSGCFPGSLDIDAFWENLVGGRDCIRETPADRWDWRKLCDGPGSEAGKAEARWGGFIEGIDEFDSMFFRVPPAQAELIDPQQRLLLEHAWKCIEDAACSAHELSGTRTGVFVGITDSGFARRASQSGPPGSATSFGGPNRVSHFLNLRGPSESIDTACSSSLVAIHRAVQAIRQGECEAALAGGVNTIITPQPQLALARVDMLSSDGRCKTFSRNANGYVRGEGIGIVFLKPLAAAERDADPIYAVILGTGENHGGHTGSFTAPNPVAQAELITEVYRRAGVDPQTVGYIEAHGTGTALGDPVEVNAFKSAFAQMQGEGGLREDCCALGSVKSNIGNLEVAAGIAGLIKAVLQLRYRTIVKTLHCEEVNPYIQLGGSPFYLAQEGKPWETVCDGQGHVQARRAGVHSYGLGGVNAHVLLEECPVAHTAPVGIPQPAPGESLIVLSAKSEQALQRRAEQLLAVLERGLVRQDQMAGVAYTLQVGRDAMEHRLAFRALSIAELQQKLRRYLAGETRIEDFHRGHAQPRDEIIAALNADGNAVEITELWMARGNQSKLLELWVRGLGVTWHRLHSQARPPRLRLPTYPFERRRHRLPPMHEDLAGRLTLSSAQASLHPLLHRNTSTLHRTRFSTSLAGEQGFFPGGRDRGRRVFPEAAQLEMARAAFQHAAEESGVGVALRNVLWDCPLRVDPKEGLELHICLDREAGRAAEVGYRIYSGRYEAPEMLIYSRGVASRVAARERNPVDLSGLRRRCRHGMSGNEVYATFRELGFEYSEVHRTLRELGSGIDGEGRAFVLARIDLPSAVANETHRYVLPPSILESALQAATQLSRAGCELENCAGPLVPVTLERVEFLAACPSITIACVRGGSPAGSGRKVDIDLCDEGGEVCVSVKGIGTRPMDGQWRLASASARLLAPGWREDGSAASAAKVRGADPDHHWIVLCGGFARESQGDLPVELDSNRTEAFAAAIPGARCVRLGGEAAAAGLEHRYEEAAFQLLKLMREVSESRRGRVLVQLVLAAHPDTHLFKGLGALLKAAVPDDGKCRYQIIWTEPGEGIEPLIEKVRADARWGGQGTIRYAEGRRHIQVPHELESFAQSPTTEPVPAR